MIVLVTWEFRISGKKLTFRGENDKTTLIYKGEESSNRDGRLCTLTNSQSIIRNLYIEFYPGKRANYSNSMFAWCRGTIQNLYVNVKGSQVASYGYFNGVEIAPNVRNCTFYFDTGTIQSDYSGSPVYNNIVTNVAPTNGSRTNIIVNDFGGDISSTKSIQAIIDAQAGVYYGEYAWDN